MTKKLFLIEVKVQYFFFFFSHESAVKKISEGSFLFKSQDPNVLSLKKYVQKS